MTAFKAAPPSKQKELKLPSRIKIIAVYYSLDGLLYGEGEPLAEEEAQRLEDRVNSDEFDRADVFGLGQRPLKIGEHYTNAAGEEYWAITE